MKEKLVLLTRQLRTKALLRSVTTEGGTRFVVIIGTNSWPASHARNWDFSVCNYQTSAYCVMINVRALVMFCGIVWSTVL